MLLAFIFQIKNTTEELCQEALGYVKDGFKSIKMKVGLNIKDDFKNVKELEMQLVMILTND